LAMNASGRTSLTVKHVTGKTANERLYLTASANREKKERVRKYAEDSASRELAADKFKVKGKSKAMMDNRQLINQPSDVGHRLHDEALRDREKRERLKDIKDVVRPLDHWSCAKCGTYHTIQITSVVPSVNTATVHPVSKKCPVCKWDQGAVEPFKPVNVALAELDPDDLPKRRYPAGSNTLFQALHSNAKGQASKLEQLKSQWKVAERDTTFAPAIPASSKNIVKKSIEQSRLAAAGLAPKPGPDNFGLHFKPSLEVMTPSEDAQLHKPKPRVTSSKVIDAHGSMGNYLAQPAAERLHKTSHQPPANVELVSSAGENNTRILMHL